MLLWRIASAKYPAFDGAGGLTTEGRWNLAGRPLVYTSTCEALTILEKLVHYDPAFPPAGGLVLVRAELSDDVAIEDARTIGLPADWNALPANAGSKNLGSSWLRSGSTVALKVPSAIAQRGSEVCVLLNPLHRDFSRIKVGPPMPFSFDGRLVRSG